MVDSAEAQDFDSPDGQADSGHRAYLTALAASLERGSSFNLPVASMWDMAFSDETTTARRRQSSSVCAVT